MMMSLFPASDVISQAWLVFNHFLLRRNAIKELYVYLICNSSASVEALVR